VPYLPGTPGSAFYLADVQRAAACCYLRYPIGLAEDYPRVETVGPICRYEMIRDADLSILEVSGCVLDGLDDNVSNDVVPILNHH
jgi:hypothetical protein